MNYADIVGGTWYPQKGMYSVVNGMYGLAKELGVHFHFNEAVSGLDLTDGKIKRIITEKKNYETDAVIGEADYHYIEQTLLPEISEVL